MERGEGAYTHGANQWNEGRGHIPAARTNGMRGGGIYPAWGETETPLKHPSDRWSDGNCKKLESRSEGV
eukprot:502516-Prorocentrum_minimum.AAC.1